MWGSVRRNEIAGRRGHQRRQAGQRARPRPSWARTLPPPRALGHRDCAAALGPARALGALGRWLGAALGLGAGLISAARAAERPGVFVPRPRSAPLRMSLCGAPPGPSPAGRPQGGVWPGVARPAPQLHSPLASPFFPPFRTPSSCPCGVPARARLPATPPPNPMRRPSCQCVLPMAPSARLPPGINMSLTCTHHPESHCHLLL